jgi:hypothetical protein
MIVKIAGLNIFAVVAVMLMPIISTAQLWNPTKSAVSWKKDEWKMR